MKFFLREKIRVDRFRLLVNLTWNGRIVQICLQPLSTNSSFSIQLKKVMICYVINMNLPLLPCEVRASQGFEVPINLKLQ